ncbi:Gx transporter family protein [bacterium]|nr:Gx transporter family protein [bacterium]
MNTQRISILSLLITLATIMASVESLIPSPFPFLRLGLANGIALLVLKWFGFRDALIVTLIRIVLAALIVGRLFQPTFFLSLSGGLAATLVMALAMKKEGAFSLIGISILGAFIHNLTQMIIASVLINQFVGIHVLPMILVTSLIAGTLIGYFTMLVDMRLSEKT